MARAEKQSRSQRSGLRADWQGVRGARLRAAAPRYLAAGAVLLFVALGLHALLWPPTSPTPPGPPAPADAPSEDFALQFARAYLGYDASRPGLRARALAAFTPQGLESGAGFFAASGSRRVLWAEVASDQPALLGGRVITVAAGISTQRAPLYLAVTVRHRRGRGLALAGYPAFVGAPAIEAASVLPVGEQVGDPAVAEVARRVIRNYLAGSAANLRADLTRDAAVTLPTVSLALQSVDRVAWIGKAGSGAVLVTVTAIDRHGAGYRLAYELGVAYRERPYVDFIEVVPTAS
jgi:hypothetical protein